MLGVQRVKDVGIPIELKFCTLAMSTSTGASLIPTWSRVSLVLDCGGLWKSTGLIGSIPGGWMSTWWCELSS